MFEKIMEVNCTEKENRMYMGEALTEPSTTYVTIAINTTGFNIASDNITEISAIRFKSGKELNIFTEKNIDRMTMEEEYYKVYGNLMGFIQDDVLVGNQINVILQFLSRDVKKYLKKTIDNDYIDTTYLIRRKGINPVKNYSVYYDNEMYYTQIQCYLTNEVLLSVLQRDILRPYEIENSIQNAYAYIKNRIERKQSIQYNSMASLIGKECVFTGKLTRMLRGDAKQIVYQHGGINSNTITKNTDYLILGGHTYDGHTTTKSSKYRKAERLKQEGYGIEIISEQQFFSMCEL